MNFLVLLLFIVINFSLISVSYKLFGKKGLIAYMVVSVIAANIQVKAELSMFGPIDFFGIELGYATLGNTMFAGIFLVTDLANEKYGKEFTRKAIYISIAMNIFFGIIMFLSTIFNITVMDYGTNTDVTSVYNMFFSIDGVVFKSLLVGNSVYLISQLIDVFVYQKVKEKFPSEKLLFLRNNISTFISQLIDTLLVTFGFCLLNIIPFEIFLGVVFTTLIIKYVIALLDTPFLYLLNKIKPMNEKEETN